MTAFKRVGSERPFALTEDRNGPAIAGDRVDVHVGGADHKVHVEHGIVDAQGAALLQGHGLVALDRIGKAHAQRQMAGGVLIEQGVVKQQAGFGDRGVHGDERTFAQIGGAFVHRDHLLQQRLILLCLYLDGLAVFEADGKVLDQLALIGQRLGRPLPCRAWGR